MKKIVLISCASKKLDERACAEEMYVSALFTKQLAYAKSIKPDAILILSAKYGLLTLDRQIDPYNVTLKNMKSADVKAWARRVLAQLAQHAELEQDTFVFLAGMPYRKFLVPHMLHVKAPTAGMRIGEQMHFLAENTQAELGDSSEFWNE